MKLLFYGVALQWRLDVRSRSLLITCYVVPLLFFAVMGSIFSSTQPTAEDTLIPSMCVMGVSMGALIGMPPSLSELYGSDIRKLYRASGIPAWLGLAATGLSALLHLLLMCGIICAAAPLLFDSRIPERLPLFSLSLAFLIVVSLAVGGVLGLAVNTQSKLTMLSQLVFLPSIMLSGILFPADLLPDFLRGLGLLFPATWGYRLLTGGTLTVLWPLLIQLAIAVVLCSLLLRRQRHEEY